MNAVVQPIRYGATLEEWRAFMHLARNDLLPVVSRPGAEIARNSKLSPANLGKVPSRLVSGKVVGVPDWTNYQATQADIREWIKQPDYGICLQTRDELAFDVDVNDELAATRAYEIIVEVLGVEPPVRRRDGSPRFAVLLRCRNHDRPKQVIHTEHGDIEILGKGQQLVVAGTHPSGSRYQWTPELPTPENITVVSPDQVDELIQRLADEFGVEVDGKGSPVANPMQPGQRHNALVSLAAKMQADHYSPEAIAAALKAANESFPEPLPADEVEGIVSWAIRKEAGYVPPEPSTDGLEAYPDEPKVKKGWQPPTAASYGVEFVPAEIPLRNFVLGNRRARGEVTAVIGPPGCNKSSVELTDAISIAIGRALFHGDRHCVQGDVLFLAGEDARRDVEARIAAILQENKLTPADLGGRLHVVYNSEQDIGYSLVHMVDNEAIPDQRFLQWIAEHPNLVAVFIDPLAAWHDATENDNNAMKVVSMMLRRLAVQANINIGFNHHVTKASMADPEAHVGNLASIRGAFLHGDVRRAYTMARLSESTAKTFNLQYEQAKRFRRLDVLKSSYGADDTQARLFRVIEVEIPNGETVGILEEVNAEFLRNEGAERQAAEEADRSKQLTDILTELLVKQSPRSLAQVSREVRRLAPHLYTWKGKPMATRSISDKLEDLEWPIATRANGVRAQIELEITGEGQGRRGTFKLLSGSQLQE